MGLNLSLIGAVNHILWQLETYPFVNNFLKESKDYFKYSLEKMDTTLTQQCDFQVIRAFWIFFRFVVFFFTFDVIYQIPLDNEHSPNR